MTVLTQGQTTMAASVPAALASDQTMNPVTSATGTVTQVASSASNVTLKASNASRKGLSIFNDSTAVLRAKCGATASSTSYTVQIPAGGYWEQPAGFAYTGIIDGIWGSANGNAYVTEFT